MEQVQTLAFWIGLAQIAGLNILLSGDNAVVIALASRGLPAHQRRTAVLGGSLVAIVLRVVFCLIVVWLLSIPYLKLVGGLLLLAIGVKLLVPETGGGNGIAAKATLWGTMQVIVIADAVMSLDNVVAIAAAADGSVLLIVLGLLISVPLIIFGSTLLLKVLSRVPLLVTAGAGLLGWIAGGVIASDAAVQPWLGGGAYHPELASKALGAALVVALGAVLARRARRRPRDIVDLAPEDRQ
ncbi:MAG: YjbE family putative metal transport protein [Acetobacteraceae bacterium]|nr:YjbE family putative metal transport protein [Acetobacteraceae bacterium]